MGQSHNMRLRQLHEHARLHRHILLRFSRPYASHCWQPDINAFRCTRRIIICVDLAGVERGTLNFQLEPRRLHIRGRRESPEPNAPEEKPLQTLAMEIDYGPFEREVELPAEIDTQGVTSHQCNGLLWIYLPLRF